MAALTLAALLLELFIGYPDRLLRAIGHPVTWMGALIATLDRRLNSDPAPPAARRAAGVLALLLLIAAGGIVAFVLARAMLALPFGLVVTALFASTLLAQRSLHAHVARVAAALEASGLPAGRAAVSHIVGRDTAALAAAGVARAAIESLAENISDGVVAPAS
jgi:adenosylcobinamide-phosphate synthase